MRIVPRFVRLSSLRWEEMGTFVTPGILHPLRRGPQQEFVTYALVYFHTFGIIFHLRVFLVLCTVIRIH
jgi:hypothetical protein